MFKKFNINDHIYIQITELGFKYLENTVDKDYIKHCITAPSYKKEINGEIWYRLQMHNVMTLFPVGLNSQILFNTNILIEDKDLH